MVPVRIRSNLDVMSKDVVDDPYPALRLLRELAPAVWIEPHDYWIMTRYDLVRSAAADWRTFSSAEGVALLDASNQRQRGTVLAADPPDHTTLRSILSEQLSPRGIANLRDGIGQAAQALVADVVDRGSFDAVGDLSRRLPVQVVADLIGIPEDDRGLLLPGADAVFAGFGPDTLTLREQLPVRDEFTAWIASITDREHLRPGSWGATVLDAVDQGRIAADSAMPLMLAYLVAGMDTTVNGIGSMLHVLAGRPDLWEGLRAEPTLAAGVFEESLRLESPVQAFFRVTTRDVDVDGVTVPKGARVMLHFGAANRDEAHYPYASEFDIRRRPFDHMAFGYGIHACAGQGLARMEARALLEALLDRVESLSLTAPPTRHFNPVIRGLVTLPVAVVPRQPARETAAAAR
jgi:cytochrome P450